MFHFNDAVKIAKSWVEFVPKVYEEYPHLLAEMYAYSLAAAYHNLKHYRVDNYMVSNTEAGGEGWQLIDPIANTCDSSDDLKQLFPINLPYFLHFCQNYKVESWLFHKRAVPTDIFSCQSPILQVPPMNLQDGRQKQVVHGPNKPLNEKQAKRNAFMICTAVKYINSALVSYKNHICEPENINIQPSLKLD